MKPLEPHVTFVWVDGADLGGGCRGYMYAPTPSEMKPYSSYALKICLPHQSITCTLYAIP